MKKNMGTTDRVLRITAAVAIVALFYTHIISGAIATVLLAFSAVFILTSFISFCPLYYPFKISTQKNGVNK